MEVCPVLHSSGCPEHISPSASLTDPLLKESQEHTHIQTCPIASTSKHFTPHEWALMQLNRIITPPPYSCKSKHCSCSVATPNTSAGHTHSHKQWEHSQHMLLVDVWFSEMFKEVKCSDRQWLYDDTFNSQEQVTHTHMSGPQCTCTGWGEVQASRMERGHTDRQTDTHRPPESMASSDWRKRKWSLQDVAIKKHTQMQTHTFTEFIPMCGDNYYSFCLLI